MFEIFRSVTPRVEPLSLDEAYLDVTENAWGLTLGREVALRIKAAIKERTGLTASAGVAPNKFLAKIASAWKKPDGLTVIAPERVEHFLQKLPVDALWGVGPVTAQRLRDRGIERLIDVRAADDRVLREAVGSHVEWLRRLADGIDDRAGRAEPRREIVRHREHLLARPHRPRRDPPRGRLDGPRRRGVAGAEGAASAARSRSRCATTTSRRSPAATRSRRRRAMPTTSPPRAVALLDRTDAGARPVRLLGVSVHNLVDPHEEPKRPELPLFDGAGVGLTLSGSLGPRAPRRSPGKVERP